MTNFFTNEFEPSSSAAWKQKIQFELEGADYNKTLLTETNEGITIKPFYHSDSFEKLNIPEGSGEFSICKPFIISSEIKTNKLAIEAINGNFKTIKFIANKPFNSNLLFKNLLDRNITFYFEFNFFSEEFLKNLFQTLKNETSYFNIDIIGKIASTGNWYKSLSSDFKIVENTIKNNLTNYSLSVNASTYHNAGANSVQEIAYALAHANEYLTFFGPEVAHKIHFNFSIGANFFFEIAKIRAFRYLYSLILKEYNTSTKLSIGTQPSLIYTNQPTSDILISNISGVNTFEEDSENEFSKVERLKNTAIDSYYIESITKQIAEKALNIFKDIEKGGGLLKQLKEGTIQRKIKENVNKEGLTTATKKRYKTLIIPLTLKSLKNEA